MFLTIQIVSQDESGGLFDVATLEGYDSCKTPTDLLRTVAGMSPENEHFLDREEIHHSYHCVYCKVRPIRGRRWKGTRSGGKHFYSVCDACVVKVYDRKSINLRPSKETVPRYCLAVIKSPRRQKDKPLDLKSVQRMSCDASLKENGVFNNCRVVVVLDGVLSLVERGLPLPKQKYVNTWFGGSSVTRPVSGGTTRPPKLSLFKGMSQPNIFASALNLSKVRALGSETQNATQRTQGTLTLTTATRERVAMSAAGNSVVTAPIVPDRRPRISNFTRSEYIVHLMLQYGASTDRWDAQGMSAFDFAQSTNYIARLLSGRVDESDAKSNSETVAAVLATDTPQTSVVARDSRFGVSIGGSTLPRPQSGAHTPARTPSTNLGGGGATVFSASVGAGSRHSLSSPAKFGGGWTKPTRRLLSLAERNKGSTKSLSTPRARSFLQLDVRKVAAIAASTLSVSAKIAKKSKEPIELKDMRSDALNPLLPRDETRLGPTPAAFDTKFGSLQKQGSARGSAGSSSSARAVSAPAISRASPHDLETTPPSSRKPSS